MAPSSSSSVDVARLLALDSARLQRLIIKVFKQTGKQSMSRKTVVQEIARAEGVTQLRGAMREQFQENVNRAIGVLLRKSPAKLVRRDTRNLVVGLPTAKKTLSSQAQLLSAIRDRILLIRFTCAECGHINEITDLSQNGWCDREGCLAPFYPTG